MIEPTVMVDDCLGRAIYCDCYIFKYKRYKVLGSITYEGLLEIMRNHENKTIVHSHEFTLSCNTCGFSKSFRIAKNENTTPYTQL